MKIISYAMIFSLCVASLLLASVGRVDAALGETAESIEADQKVLSALRHSASTRGSHTVHEIDSGSTVVREYISPSGIIFAVAWNGLMHPDLSQLLGRYLDEYQETLKGIVPSRGQRRLQVKTNRIIVEKWGHMRNLQGRAYVPQLLPAGLNIDEIK